MGSPPQAEHRPAISALPAGQPRPLWSVMIPTFNSGELLRQALESVLAQDPGAEQMQIEVVDDCSTAGDPASLTHELGGERVGFFRQTANRGHVENFNTCLLRSRGRLIHLLHADDLVRPGFYEEICALFERFPDAGAAFCRYEVIDPQGRVIKTHAAEQDHPGVLENWLEKIALGQRLQPPAMVVRREVYESLGGFDRRIASYGEDWEMWVRIAAHYSTAYLPEPLAAYRVGGSSLTSRSFRSGQNLADYLRAVEICREHLPPDRAEAISRQARRLAARAAIRRSYRALDAGDFESPLAQARMAWRASPSPEIAARSSYLLLRWLWRRARQR
jgi:glycosyltransferase involved in cell wall biosynthesis